MILIEKFEKNEKKLIAENEKFKGFENSLFEYKEKNEKLMKEKEFLKEKAENAERNQRDLEKEIAKIQMKMQEVL